MPEAVRMYTVGAGAQVQVRASRPSKDGFTIIVIRPAGQMAGRWSLMIGATATAAVALLSSPWPLAIGAVLTASVFTYALAWLLVYWSRLPVFDESIRPIILAVPAYPGQPELPPAEGYHASVTANGDTFPMAFNPNREHTISANGESVTLKPVHLRELIACTRKHNGQIKRSELKAWPFDLYTEFCRVAAGADLVSRFSDRRTFATFEGARQLGLFIPDE